VDLDLHVGAELSRGHPEPALAEGSQKTFVQRDGLFRAGGVNE
jgi:hypothetical protein